MHYAVETTSQGTMQASGNGGATTAPMAPPPKLQNKFNYVTNTKYITSQCYCKTIC